MERGLVVDPASSISISVCIVCRNEGDRLAECLDSVAWADEVIVMDLESSDDSASVARARGARVLSRQPHPIVEPLREELAGVASGRFILALDPDERIRPELARELVRIATHEDVDAVVIPRMNVDFGYAPSSPLQRYEPQLRMYRRGRVRWPSIPNALPHVPEDRLHRLPHRDELTMVHIRNRTVAEALERAMRYAPAEAQAMVDHGERFTALRMSAAMAKAVDRQFIATRAWRDGVPGMLRAVTLVGFNFWVWAAFWQLSERGRVEEDDRLVAQRAGAFAFAWRAGRKVNSVLRRVRGGDRAGGESWKRRAAREQSADPGGDAGGA